MKESSVDRQPAGTAGPAEKKAHGGYIDEQKDREQNERDHAGLLSGNGDGERGARTAQTLKGGCASSVAAG